MKATSLDILNATCIADWNDSGSWSNGVPVDGDQVTLIVNGDLSSFANVPASPHYASLTLDWSTSDFVGTLDLTGWVADVLRTAVDADPLADETLSVVGLTAPAIEPVRISGANTATFDLSGSTIGSGGTSTRSGSTRLGL